VVLVLCGVMLWGAVWFRSRAITPVAMLKRLPTDNAVVVFIDFSQLRRVHLDQLLDSMTVGQDPEYQSFIQKIDFDYRHDLDTAMMAVAPAGKFVLAKGRFDWKALTTYVMNVDGKCNNSVCRLVGSTPDRRISFFPLQGNLMALAVSQDESAAERMQTVNQRPDPELPDAPIWMMIPPAIINSGQALPEGTQMFARTLEHAKSVMLWVAPAGDAFVARLSVQFATVADAVDVASKLTKITSLLRDLIERESQKPNPADLSGFLTAGSFHNEGTKVLGSWPVQHVLLENLLGGK
jgi:hypothetical protein